MEYNMSTEEYQCDMTYVLQNTDFTVLEKLSSFYYELEKRAAMKVESVTTESEHTKMKVAKTNKILELEQQVKMLQLELDKLKLEQKIVSKKITNVVKQEEKLKNDIKDAETHRDSLSLELVDLKEEVQDRREKKQKTWSAIKRATAVYKSKLNFSINMEERGDYNHVEVSFFKNNTNLNGKYYVQLINEGTLWKVEKIHPVLREEHWIDLKSTIDSTTQSRIANITAFLALLRITFLRYYMHNL